MEAFSLLNYWKSSGGGAVTFLPQSSDSSSSCRYSAGESTGTTTIVTSVTETEDEEADDDNDEGPFFDLEFALPAEDEEEEDGGGRRGGGEGDSDCTDGGCEFKFTLSSCSGGEDRVDPDSLDDVYFKETIVEDVEPPSSSEQQTCSVKAPAAQLSASILKSATKLRVFMLGMKKSKLIQAKSEANFGSEDIDKQNPPPPPPQPSSHSPESQQKSTVTVNLKVEEVPIISLFTRENSSKNSSSSSSSTSSSSSFSLKKQNGNESVVSDEKRFMMMQKYLKKVKPLYIRVSRRYGEKLQHSGQLTAPSATRSTAEKKAESPVTTKTNKPGNNININIPAGLKVVRKHLGKSRSSSSTATTPSSTATTVTTPSDSRRRDDSLLQQQDSIQSAILHCKRSFNSSRDKDPSVLPRSVSEPSSYEK